jgi:transposase
MMLERGFAIREIATKIGCGSHTTILKLKKKYKKTGKVENKKYSSQLYKLNKRKKCTVIRCLITGECSNAVQLTKTLQINEKVEVNVETVCRTLRKNGLFSRIKRKKPLLSKKHCKKRFDFAKTYKDWTKVIWFDKSKFQIFGSNGH